MGKNTRAVAAATETTVRIRAATAEDVSLLSELETRLFPAEPWSAQAIAGHLAAPHTLSLLLTDGDDPAGYLFAGFCPPEGELYRIAVLPAYRRRGYGRALLDELFRYAAERSVGSFWLEVRESNTAAIKLYRSVGFSVSSRREKYYRDPFEAALVLTAELPKESF